MLAISFSWAEGVWAAMWLLLRLIVWRRQARVDWKREAVLLLMYVNFAVLLRIAFFPMNRVDGRVQPLLFDPAHVLPFWINLVPLVNLLDYSSRRELLLNVIGNVTMFLPSGIVLPIVYRQLSTFKKVLLAGAGISLCIELLQLPFFGRSSDIDDLLLNTLGVILGYGLYALAQRRRKPAKE